MPERDIGVGFRDVDSSGDARGFIAYLDEAGNLLAGLKRELIAALNLEPGDAALDVGCGTGDDLCSLAAVVGPSGRVVGVDRSEGLVAGPGRGRGRAAALSSRCSSATLRRCRSPTTSSRPPAWNGC